MNTKAGSAEWGSRKIGARVRSLAPISGLLCGIACASTPALKAGAPAQTGAAPAPSPFVVEVRADSLLVGGKVTPVSATAIDKAVKRELELSRSAVLHAEAGADRETFAIMLSKLRSAADRLWFEHHGEKLDVSDFYPDEARIEWLTLSWETNGPTLTFWDSVKRDSIEPVVWRFGDRKSEVAVLKLLDEHCHDDATCRIGLAVEGAGSVSDIAAALQALTALRELQKVQFDVLSTALPHSPVKLGEGEEPKEASRSAGRIPPEMIQSTIRSRSNTLRACYTAGLQHRPRPTGFMSVKFVITQDGKVQRAERAASRLLDEQVIQCVVDAFRQLRFPESPTGIVTVVYPIHFVS
jgi:hypothetical protein